MRESRREYREKAPSDWCERRGAFTDAPLYVDTKSRVHNLLHELYTHHSFIRDFEHGIPWIVSIIQPMWTIVLPPTTTATEEAAADT